MSALPEAPLCASPTSRRSLRTAEAAATVTTEQLDGQFPPAWWGSRRGKEAAILCWFRSSLEFDWRADQNCENDNELVVREARIWS